MDQETNFIIEQNNVKVLGRGTKPMILAHGFGCDQNMWRHVIPAFLDDYKVIAFDHVGAGASDLTRFDQSKYASLEGYAEDVLGICNEVAGPGTIYVGHSVSAMIGVLAAIRQPALFEHLILVAPSPCYINDGDYIGGFNKSDIEELLEFMDANYLGWSHALAPTIVGNPDRPEVAQELENSFCRTDPEIAKHFARTTFLSDNRSDLLKCNVPALILQCADDVIAPRTVGEFMHRELRESELYLMKATGHCPNLSAPEETIGAIKEYLATHGT
ncbi:alpha/beta fold hydrolase [Noviherbaspirillum aerium]|uniref:alpha/beta fold hydrolase n=1 Tax=Noviherbaspirillum aerium TaxID=2588497 RepID=UPI00124C6AF1|nr:alpha/beta hydrolase [Noviherbaspirillum aerium]